MSEHLHDDDLIRFARGDVPADAVGTIVRHLAHCASCAVRARDDERLGRAASALAAELSAEAGHASFETLTDLVEGALSPDEEMVLRQHIAGCRRCAEDLDDLRAVAVAVEPRRRRFWIPAVAAASIAIALLLAVVARFAPSRPAPPSAKAIPVSRPVPPRSEATATPAPADLPRAAREYARPEWEEAVREAIRTGGVAMPAALAQLQYAADPPRGPKPTPNGGLDPAGEIVETTRPLFSWTRVGGASYVVSVFREFEAVTESPVLHEPRWQPPRDLARGTVYHWQVEVRRPSGNNTIIPAPPAPPAYFRILDEASTRELRSARERHGDDPLLLGVLYARNGLDADAQRELSRAGTAESRKILESVRRWRTEDGGRQ